MKAYALPICLLCLLTACASRQRDHFYILTVQPQSEPERTADAPATVSLRVSLPSVVDRSEMVINTGADGIAVLEHQRWAAPLSDLATQVLAEDMERRRRNVLVAGPGGSHAGAAAFKVIVDIVRMTARQGGRVNIATHWRILDVRAGRESAGGAEFSAPLAPDGYGELAQALSQCLAQLADRLLEQMPQAGS